MRFNYWNTNIYWTKIVIKKDKHSVTMLTTGIGLAQGHNSRVFL